MTIIKTDSNKTELCDSLIKKMGYCKAKIVLKQKYNIDIWLEVQQ